jgi:hypothetical protein
VQPPGHGTGFAEGLELDEGDEEGLLYCVEGVVAVAQHADCRGVQRGPVPLEDASQGFDLAGSCPRHQGGVAQRQILHAHHDAFGPGKVHELPGPVEHLVVTHPRTTLEEL